MVSGLVCAALAVVTVGLIAVTPIEKKALQSQKESAQALLQQPEYAAVEELINTKTDLARYKSNLTDAIAALPHGATNTAGIIGDLTKLTGEYGTVSSISTDYSAKVIRLSFTTLNYDFFVYWQKAVTEDGRFSFLEPPTFDGNGLIYTVNANLTATDFDQTANADAAAEGMD